MFRENSRLHLLQETRNAVSNQLGIDNLALRGGIVDSNLVLEIALRDLLDKMQSRVCACDYWVMIVSVCMSVLLWVYACFSRNVQILSNLHLTFFLFFPLVPHVPSRVWTIGPSW